MNYNKKMNSTSQAGLLTTVKKVLPELFQHIGIHLEFMPEKSSGMHSADLLMQLAVDDRSINVAVCARSRIADQVIDLANEQSQHSTIALIVLPHIRAELQQRLKSLGINFADLTGTIWLQAPGIRIDVQGNLPVPDSARVSTKQQINPFSKKASAAVRALCENFPKAVSLPFLAEQTGLSRGWIFGVVRELVARGYATNDGDGALLSNPVAMLRDWISDYKWSRNTPRHFVVPFDGSEFLQQVRRAFEKQDNRWALTLTAAAQIRVDGLSQNNSFHVYAEANDNTLSAALEALYAQPVRDGGNLILYAPPYYGSSVFIGAHKSEGANVVSDVQLLLDLAHYPVRGPELAELLVRSQIARQFDLSSSESQLLIQQFS
jgi:hypothetical protein